MRGEIGDPGEENLSREQPHVFSVRYCIDLGCSVPYECMVWRRWIDGDKHLILNVSIFMAHTYKLYSYTQVLLSGSDYLAEQNATTSTF